MRESSRDTLALWMAHHVAELITVAENAPDGERKSAADRAADVILKLWTRRHALPGSLDPLSPLREALPMLARLQPDANPFDRYQTQGTDRILSEVFDGLASIARVAVLRTVKPVKKINPEEAEPFLTEEESRVIGALNGWIELFEKEAVDDHRAVLLLRFLKSTDAEASSESEYEPLRITVVNEPKPADPEAVSELTHEPVPRIADEVSEPRLQRFLLRRITRVIEQLEILRGELERQVQNDGSNEEVMNESKIDEGNGDNSGEF
jgi:hypothetical protein